MAHEVTAPALQRLRRLLNQRVRPVVAPTIRRMDVVATDEIADPISLADAQALALHPFTIGDSWGRPWHTRWFKLSARIPEESIAGSIVCHVDLGFSGRGDGFQVEGLAWQNGRRVQAVQPDRRFVPIEVPPWSGPAPGEVTLWIEAAATPIIAGHASGYGSTPLGDRRTAGEVSLYALRRADLCVFHPDVSRLAVVLQSLMDLIIDMPEDDPSRARLFGIAEDVENILEFADVPGTAAEAVEFVEQQLGALPGNTSSSVHRVLAAGHAHLDTAWLWPMRETKRKAVRTFVNAVELLKTNPDMVFSHSQAQHYDWVRQEAPEVFEDVRRLVITGQWEPVGGMWVETDLNLPSGESLLRQFVEGQKFFGEQFGTRSRVMFLPDDFGYPGSVPQIARQAGCRWFFTQKMSWNETNVFPHHTFWWEGIDGSRVFTHFSPIETYNALLTPSQIRFAARNFRDHSGASQSLALFGHGDGGGGPTQEMVDRARFVNRLPAVPRVDFSSVERFFESAQAEYGAAAPTWVGEMYLEKHRGTYSSQVRTKQGNRRCERLLHELELWSALTGRQQSEASDLWRRVLVQQFHDVIPGSSIAWVHQDTEREHEEIAASIEELLRALSSTGPEGSAQESVIFVSNPAPVSRREVVAVEDDFTVVDLPAFGQQELNSSDASRLPEEFDPVRCSRGDDGSIGMSNGLVSVTIDHRGHLVSYVVQASGREMIGSPLRVGSMTDEAWPAGHLLLRRDTPAEYDAWDVDRADADGRASVLSAIEPPSITVGGPGIGQVTARFVHGDSTHILHWTLRAGSPRLDFRLEADWRCTEQRLQWTMPIRVLAREALCGVQFGHVRRARHSNTSWDAARFEVCAHRYVYVSDSDCGVALLADGPRGYDLRGHGVSLTLLRAPQFPDPTCDIGRHVIEWSIMSDGGGGDVDGVEEEAARLAHPVRLSSAPIGPVKAGIDVQAKGVLVSAVKLAEDGSGDLVVRLWECRGVPSSGALVIRGRTASVTACDAIEVDLGEVDLGDVDFMKPDVMNDPLALGSRRSLAPTDPSVEVAAGVMTVAIELAPFEIRTYRLR